MHNGTLHINIFFTSLWIFSAEERRCKIKVKSFRYFHKYLIFFFTHLWCFRSNIPNIFSRRCSWKQWPTLSSRQRRHSCFRSFRLAHVIGYNRFNRTRCLTHGNLNHLCQNTLEIIPLFVLSVKNMKCVLTLLRKISTVF